MNDRTPWRSAGIIIGATGPVVAAVALVPVRGVLVATNVALVLVVTVVVASMLGGWEAGAVAAAVATVSYDFFHTRPYLSLTIASGDEIETAALLLVVGISVGVLAGWARATTARARAEIARLHRVAELVARGAPSDVVLWSATRELEALLHLERCRFEAAPFTDAFARLDRSGTVLGTGPLRFSKGEFELPREGVELPVYRRGYQVGRFVLMPTAGQGVALDERIVAVAIADQVGAAIATPPLPSRGA